MQATSIQRGSAKVSSWVSAVLAGIGGSLSIFFIGYSRDISALPLLIPPFGASCVLAFGYPASPFAHPRNIIGGHLLAATVGLIACYLFGYGTIGAAVGVGLAITGMMLTETTHPPAGANPIVVAILHPDASFLVMPVFFGAVSIVLLAWVYNRLLVWAKLGKI